MTKAYLAIGNEVKACCEVGEIYEIHNSECFDIIEKEYCYVLPNIKDRKNSYIGKTPTKKALKKQGYTDQPYAIEFKQFEEVDIPIECFTKPAKTTSEKLSSRLISIKRIKGKFQYANLYIKGYY